MKSELRFEESNITAFLAAAVTATVSRNTIRGTIDTSVGVFYSSIGMTVQQQLQRFRVPFYSLIPNAVEPPYPIVLTIHGHCKDGKDLTVGAVADNGSEIIEERRDFVRQAVQREYATVEHAREIVGERGSGSDD